ncbi:hypothetical protein IWZ01DRAFT_502387 [Phyllosticta capitalensis]
MDENGGRGSNDAIMSTAAVPRYDDSPFRPHTDNEKLGYKVPPPVQSGSHSPTDKLPQTPLLPSSNTSPTHRPFCLRRASRSKKSSSASPLPRSAFEHIQVRPTDAALSSRNPALHSSVLMLGGIYWQSPLAHLSHHPRPAHLPLQGFIQSFTAAGSVSKSRNSSSERRRRQRQRPALGREAATTTTTPTADWQQWSQRSQHVPSLFCLYSFLISKLALPTSTRPRGRCRRSFSFPFFQSSVQRFDNAATTLIYSPFFNIRPYHELKER